MTRAQKEQAALFLGVSIGAAQLGLGHLFPRWLTHMPCKLMLQVDWELSWEDHLGLGVRAGTSVLYMGLSMQQLELPRRVVAGVPETRKWKTTVLLKGQA